jgi:beta-lactamase class A
MLFAALLVGGILGVRAFLNRGSASTSSRARPQATVAATAPRIWVDPQYVSRYQDQIDRYVAGLAGSYSVAVLDVATGASLTVAPDTPLRAASVNKLELVVSLYRRANAGSVSLDATTVVSADEIQRYGTGVIQLGGGGQTFTYRDLARLAIEESDNTAAYVLEQRLGVDSVEAELQSWGLTRTSMADNTTTAGDVALLLSKLAHGELLPRASTTEILNFMENTAWTDRLQSGVPGTVPVAHKIGTDIDVYNDAAIISPDSRPYVVVVLSSGADENSALLAMTQVSRLVYQFEGGLPAVTRTLGR